MELTTAWITGVKNGDYGRVYLSYEFTDKLGMGTMGEFTGYAWTQNGEQIERATLRQAFIKNHGIRYVFTGCGDQWTYQHCLGPSGLRVQRQ